MKVRLMEFDLEYLDASWCWLNDAEVREAIMAPVISRTEQKAFFESLPNRSGYKIWGVETLDGLAIGAAGLKNFRGDLAEYWGYFGEKKFWGKGLGYSMISEVERRASELGLQYLDLSVGKSNLRAIALYKRYGFEIEGAGDASTIRMVKRIDVGT